MSHMRLDASALPPSGLGPASPFTPNRLVRWSAASTVSPTILPFARALSAAAEPAIGTMVAPPKQEGSFIIMRPSAKPTMCPSGSVCLRAWTIIMGLGSTFTAATLSAATALTRLSIRGHVASGSGRPARPSSGRPELTSAWVLKTRPSGVCCAFHFSRVPSPALVLRGPAFACCGLFSSSELPCSTAAPCCGHLRDSSFWPRCSASGLLAARAGGSQDVSSVARFQ
mmetsp:Transcript_47330/g.151088  ORF Transcript_47330/g.151088 Transcript_47330/m.151088 type:complete len:227 (+) Transcript_47330:1114-1794(+)